MRSPDARFPSFFNRVEPSGSRRQHSKVVAERAGLNIGEAQAPDERVGRDGRRAPDHTRSFEDGWVPLSNRASSITPAGRICLSLR